VADALTDADGPDDEVAAPAFGQPELAGLARVELRRLCHGLLLGEGAVVENYRTIGEFDEFTTSAAGIWRTHRAVVRIFHRRITQDDLDRIISDIQAVAAVEAVVLTPHELDSGLAPPIGVHLVPPQELANRIMSSPLVEWDEGRPAVAAARLELLLQLDDVSALLDPIGIQWLPSLALNELPSVLVGHGVEPQDLFEQKTFRILTASFRFGGVRYGEAARGRRLPDSVIFWPDGSPTAAMIDCKAASSGYRMDADHLLRFVRYWESLGPELEKEGRSLEYLGVVSSFFPGVEGERHPYHGRATEIHEKTGLKLAYLSASDLAWTSAQIEARDLPLAERCSLDWRRIFEAGMVSSGDLRGLIDGAK
jgi:hypothetical protein